MIKNKVRVSTVDDFRSQVKDAKVQGYTHLMVPLYMANDILAALDILADNLHENSNP